MNKRLLFLAAAVISFSFIMNGCKKENKLNESLTSVENVNAASQDTFKLTLDEIKKKYTNAKIKDIQSVGKEYVLVESQKDNFASTFDIYNLKTGDMDTLPTMGDFVTLEKIENENYFVLLSSGRNSETNIGDFPHLIRCIRIKNDLKKNDDFTALIEDKYFSLDNPLQSGTKVDSVMSSINVSLDGIQVQFKPVKGKETEFYAAATDIPPTRTSYDKNKKQLTFEIKIDKLEDNLKANKKVTLVSNEYLTSYELKQEKGKIYLALNLKDAAKEYMVKTKRLPDGLPYFSVSFKGEY